ncbi:DUF1501 domain-containing protein [Hyalangium gracile]|uniref:DUF1501 domain-containing protein n=1 Tax=Hyalangium gracile TaxID=394092 RepID=UPI001CCB1EFC|nr:DUF1501 domain-containing protein [Hyalangium gracile]
MSRATSRREFLRRTGLLTSLLGVARAPFALNLMSLGEAAAQSAPTDYKALVCLFLTGGNDPFNTVLATDASSWRAYTTARASSLEVLALDPSKLLPISPVNARGRTFALNPRLARLQELFALKRLAIVPNVGPLCQPTTKEQYNTSDYPRPPKLFSHSDQQAVWQAFQPEGNLKGWGGRMGDLMLAANGSASNFTCVSATGNALWLVGNAARQYQLGATGAIRMGSDGGNQVYGSTQLASALERVVGGSRSSHVLEADVVAVSQRSMNSERILRGALPNPNVAPYGSAPFWMDPLLQYDNPLTYTKMYSPLAHQFQIIARMITASQALGVKRQVFFASLSSFDTHQNQLRDHANLLSQVSHALGYFDAVLGGLGMRNQVTTFTSSEFGRTLGTNGGGSDHGWGSHHFVMGGAVKGGDLYGRFPDYSLRSASGDDFLSPDLLGNGALLPALSVDQYAATLARWFGVSETDLELIFPNLSHFSVKDLGFMA